MPPRNYKHEIDGPILVTDVILGLRYLICEILRWLEIIFCGTDHLIMFAKNTGEPRSRFIFQYGIH